MLTGDKLETAENIAKSCNLINEEMTIQKITSQNEEEIVVELEKINSMFSSQKQSSSKKSLILEGHSLPFLLSPLLSPFFLSLLLRCHSIICCRCTPKQKAQMVRLVRTGGNKITLAIGDGVNDCNMIQEANIGVGVFGNEGMRAVQVSDFAVGEFQVLGKLVLFHGRQNYMRVAEMINYFFFKNFVFAMCQVIFQQYSGYSGQTLFNDWFITLYNLVFTCLPIMTKTIYDSDISYNYLRNNGKNYLIERIKLIESIMPYLY